MSKTRNPDEFRLTQLQDICTILKNKELDRLASHLCASTSKIDQSAKHNSPAESQWVLLNLDLEDTQLIIDALGSEEALLLGVSGEGIATQVSAMVDSLLDYMEYRKS